MKGARRRWLFDGALFVATALALTFLLLPLVAIFLRVPLGELVAQLGSGVAVDALRVTMETNAITQALILLVGTPTAYFIASRRFRGRALAITLIELPLVLPPAVAGLALLAAFGRLGLLGSTFEVLGLTVSTGTKAAVVLAVAYIASPFYIRGAIASFEALDQPLLDASRTLGAGPARTFFRIALPLAAKGIGAAAALSFARGIGEFGATLFFAGSFQGVTQTLPLAIYAQFDVNLDLALGISALLVLVSAAILLIVKLLPSWTRFGSTSAYPFARSTSS
jgi:molybdate transport system permease protein